MEDLKQKTDSSQDAYKLPEVERSKSGLRLFRKRIKLVWDGPGSIQARWHLALFGFYDRAVGERFGGIAISVRGLLLWGVLGVVAGYQIGAAGLYWFRKSNPYNVATYGDVLLWPFRPKAMRELTGQALIREGFTQLEARRYGESLFAFEAGLRMYPQDTAAKLFLAQIYVQLRERPKAGRVLMQGIPEYYLGRSYLKKVFEFARAGEDYDWIVRIASDYLDRAAESVPQRDREWLRSQRIQAWVALGHHQEVLSELKKKEEQNLPEHWEQRIQSLVALQQVAEAEGVLDQWMKVMPQDRNRVLVQRAKLYAQSGRKKDLVNVLQELRTNNPADPGSYIFSTVQLAKAGESTIANAVFGHFLGRFSSSCPVLELMSAELTEVASTEFVSRCIQAAKEQGFPVVNFMVHLQTCYIRRCQVAEARKNLQDSIFEQLKKHSEGRQWLEWQTLLLNLVDAPNQANESRLVEFLQSRAASIRMWRDTNAFLSVVEKVEFKERLLTAGRKSFPRLQGSE